MKISQVKQPNLERKVTKKFISNITNLLWENDNNSLSKFINKLIEIDNLHNGKAHLSVDYNYNDFCAELYTVETETDSEYEKRIAEEKKEYGRQLEIERELRNNQRIVAQQRISVLEAEINKLKGIVDGS